RLAGYPSRAFRTTSPTRSAAISRASRGTDAHWLSRTAFARAVAGQRRSPGTQKLPGAGVDAVSSTTLKPLGSWAATLDLGRRMDTAAAARFATAHWRIRI